MAVNSRADTELRVSRWLAVCALVLGLFAMHGLPAAAGTGCHDDPTVTMTDPAPVAQPMAPVAAPMTPQQQRAGAMASSPSSPHSTGGSCVSTPPRIPSGLPGPSLLGVAGLLAALLVTAGAQAGIPWWRARRRRGPPVAGIVLLTQVCVSRT